MLKKFLEENLEKGYVVNFHYSPEPREIYISMATIGIRPNFASVTLPASYLSDEEGLVAEMRKLIEKLEKETPYGRGYSLL